jgi:hydrogenase maturation protease
LKGHEFTRADKSIGLTPALAAEGCISQFFSELLTFSAACLAPEGIVLEIAAKPGKTLILGLGNILMGDEGVGVHVVRAVEQRLVQAFELPSNIECLDGGTGGFILLEPLQQADRIVLIDAAADGNPPGTVTRTTPKFARDYPPTLTAHDIGVKDLLDVFYMQGGGRDVVLYAITIDPQQPISLSLSATVTRAAEEAVQLILGELEATCAV